MPTDGLLPFLNAITPHRANLLAVLDDEGSLAGTARRLYLSRETIRTQIRQLRELAAVDTTADLMRLWRQSRADWLRSIAMHAAIPYAELTPWEVGDRALTG